MYDSYFRQQAVGYDKADWSCINQFLFAVTLMQQGRRDKGRCCVLCLESDHMEEQCALYTPLPKLKKSVEKSSSEERDTVAGRGRGEWRMACFAWNQSDCRFPACKYRHVCDQTCAATTKCKRERLFKPTKLIASKIIS